MAPGSGWLTIDFDKASRDTIINSYYTSLFNGSEKLPNNATFSFLPPSDPPAYGFDGYAQMSEG